MVKRTDRAKLRITKANFYEYFTEGTMPFQNILGASTAIPAKRRLMKSEVSFSQVRFLYPSDIIDVMTRRIDKHKGSNNLKKHIESWHNVRGQAYVIQSSN